MKKIEWTRKEEDFLKENFYNMTRKELAEKIGKSRSSITNKMFSLNLKNWNIIPEEYKKLTEIELSYLAGLLDGEGSIMLIRRKKKNTSIFYEPLISIHNCSLLFKDWFKKRGFYVSVEKRERGQPKYMIRIYGYQIKHLLKLLLSYLCLKQAQAYLMIDWIEERQKRVKISGHGINFKETERMKELRENIKLLNSKQREKLYSLEREIINKYFNNKDDI